MQDNDHAHAPNQGYDATPVYTLSQTSIKGVGLVCSAEDILLAGLGSIPNSNNKVRRTLNIISKHWDKAFVKPNH
jgi:hypothetical protein